MMGFSPKTTHIMANFLEEKENESGVLKREKEREKAEKKR
jgi:hypothetical protein